MSYEKECGHCRRSLGCPLADTLAEDGNPYLTRGAEAGGRRERSDVIRVKTSQCRRHISNLSGLMKGKVTVVMEERGNPSLQCVFLEQITFSQHAVINPH